MNTALPDMLHCADLTVLERQRARLKWQQDQLHLQFQEQQQQGYFSELSGVFSSQLSQGQGFPGSLMSGDSLLGEVVVKPDPGFEDGWPDLGKIEVPAVGFEPSGYVNAPDFEMSYAISRTYSCPPTVAAAVEVKEGESAVSEKMSLAVGKESFKKRKGDKLQTEKVVSEENSKKMKGCAEAGDSKITGQNTKKGSSSNNSKKKENSSDTSKDNSKVTEDQKPDYIHVRARRGQATDSHSLAERVRREKISERMKYLQDLVPGCNKITGKAGMLDEIINYVQSLQRQVEFLSMKLATVNPRLDFNIDDLFAKEVFPSCTGNFPAIGISPELSSPDYLQFNPVQPVVSSCGPQVGITGTDLALRRTISAPVSVPAALGLDSSCFPQMQPTATWDPELQSLYNVAFDQGRVASAFTSQPFTVVVGSSEACHLKTEM